VKPTPFEADFDKNKRDELLNKHQDRKVPKIPKDSVIAGKAKGNS
jgi:hypothetical protein